MSTLTAEDFAVVAARLRDSLSIGVVEHWTAPIPADFDTRPLHHLPPPASGEDCGQSENDPRVSVWQSAFRPGLCYYRVGPGFIQIKDRRDPAAASSCTVDHELLIEVFLRCERPLRMTEQNPRDQAALEFLLLERLLLRFGDLVTIAPYRMRRWPIPSRFA